MNTPVQQREELIRAMTLTDATMLVAGSMIGSGIFIVSAGISRSVGSPFWLLVVWLVTGIMTVLGALSYGELAAMFPRAGGQYVFLRESMGPLAGFLYGWTLFCVIQTGTIAAVAVAFSRFVSVLFPVLSPERFSWFPEATIRVPGGTIELGLSFQRLIALASIWLLTGLNLRGLKVGKFVQTTFTLVKAGTLVFIVILGFSVGRNGTAMNANFGNEQFWGQTELTFPFIIALGTSLVGSLFASDAWNNITFAAAEVRNPNRNLPLALVLGTGLVIVLYFMVNVAYLMVLPLRGDASASTVLGRGIQHATQDRVGTAMAEVMFGSAGGVLLAMAIVVSTFGANNGLILAGARVYYAMARDGLFFRHVGGLNEKGVPATALVIQAIWISFLCLTGSYGQLLNYVIFAALMFYILTTIGLFRLRYTQPALPRPSRTFGYPLVPAIYIVLATVVATILLLAKETRVEAISGLVFVLVGIPVYYGWRGLGLRSKAHAKTSVSPP